MIIVCIGAINYFCNQLSVCNARYEMNLEERQGLMLVFKWLFIKKKSKFMFHIRWLFLALDIACSERLSFYFEAQVTFRYISLKDHFLPHPHSDIYRHLQLTLFRL
jgi:hypothetical protein